MPQMHRFPFALTTLIGGILPLAVLAAEPPGVPDWRISGVRVLFSDGLREFSSSSQKMELIRAPEGKAFVEVQAVFESPQGVIGPVSFSAIKMKLNPTAPSGAAPGQFALLAVGTLDKECTYLNSDDVQKGRQANIQMTSGAEFQVSRVGDEDVQFVAKAKKMALCLAFSVPEVMVGDPPQGADRIELLIAGPSGGVAPGATRRLGFIAASAVLALAMAFLARRRLGAAWDAARTTLEETPADGAEQAIPKLDGVTPPVMYMPPPDEPAGPGAQMFSAATLALQGDDYEKIEGYLQQSLALGLPPSRQGQAHLMLAETAFRRGDLVRAIHAYHDCLKGEQVALWPAQAAAANLAVIYRKLGMRSSALVAERIVAAASSGEAELLEPSRVERIDELANGIKNQTPRAQLRNSWRAGAAFRRALLRPGVSKS